jgi:hypothetical protein
MQRLTEVPSKPILDIISDEHKILLMQIEDEYSRRRNFHRIFPTSKTYARYAKFFESPRPLQLLLSRWEKEKRRINTSSAVVVGPSTQCVSQSIIHHQIPPAGIRRRSTSSRNRSVFLLRQHVSQLCTPRRASSSHGTTSRSATY